MNDVLCVREDEAATKLQIPRLENGDRLSRAEFERRYEAMPSHIKAELIEGVVHMPSPVRFDSHTRPDGRIITWIGNYSARTAGTEFGPNGTVRLDLDNEPQPDCILFIHPSSGGAVQISSDDYIVGAPELVVEVAGSSVSIDLGPKKTAYRRNGVKEYIVWRVEENEIDWFILRDSGFEQLAGDEAGILRSEAFPGLWLDRPAMLRCDLAAVLRVLDQGLASADHARFVANLQAARKT